MLPKYSPVAICPATIAADKIPKEDNVEFQNQTICQTCINWEHMWS